MKYRVINAIERQPFEVDSSEILTAKGVSNITTRSQSFFDIDFRGKKLVVVPGNHIGTIPLTENIIVDVKPKFSVSNLLHMISRSDLSLMRLEHFARSYEEDSSRVSTIFEFLVENLLEQLKSLTVNGVYKTYNAASDNTSSIKGRINVQKTISTNWPRGIYHHAHIDFFEFSPDNHFNRLIKYAIWYCLKHLRGGGYERPDLVSGLKSVYPLFDRVYLDPSRSFLLLVRKALNDNKVPATRGYYFSLCELCILLIKDGGLEIESSGQDIELSSFVIDMAAVFESYLRNSLRGALDKRGQRIRVLNGNKEGRGWLFRDNKTFDAQPDMVIKRDGKVKIIIDAKYKEKVKETDRYQIISHALSYSAEKAILLLPEQPNGKSGLHRMGAIGHPISIDVYCYFFNLGEDLIKEEGKIEAAIFNLLSP